MKISDFPYF